MEIRDLTGRHSISVIGTAPRRVPTDGPDGRGYTEFNGSGCLLVADPGHDFVWGLGPLCVDVVAWLYPTRDLCVMGGGASPSIFDGGQGHMASVVPNLSGYQSHESIYYGAAPWLNPTISPGWRAIRYDVDATGKCTTYVDGVVVASNLSAKNVVAIYADELQVGGNWSVNQYFTVCKLAGLRITRASRGATSFDLSATGAADPLWSQTVLNLSLAATPRGDHDDLLRRLLPPVSIDRNGPGIMVETLAAGGALDAAQASAAKLLAEADPRSTALLLPDWERNYGLEAGSATDASRRAALVAQILAGGGQSRAFYVSLAGALGYTATVSEFAPHTVMSDVTFPLFSGAWRHVWKVRAHANAGAVATATLEALINKLKPAHTRVVFEYY